MALALCVAFQVLSLALGADVNLGVNIGSGNTGGSAWIKESLQLLLFVIGGAAILSLQYWHRKTSVARWLAVCVIILCLLAQHLPWQTAFAMEHSLARDPTAAKDVSIAFDPSMGKSQRSSGLSSDSTGKQQALRAAHWTSFSLPLHLTGLKGDTFLRSDGFDVHLIGPDGNNIIGSKGPDLEIHKEDPGQNEARIWQDVYIPNAIYNRIKDLPVSLEIDYSLTLLPLSTSNVIAALNGDQRIPGLGWCKTRVSDGETDIRLVCLQVGNGPSCGTAVLELGPGGQRNPEVSSCVADYTPFFRGSLSNDFLTRFGTPLPFRDPAGLTRYPVDGPKLMQAQVALKTYHAVDHFTARLVITNIRLRDWQTT